VTEKDEKNIEEIQNNSVPKDVNVDMDNEIEETTDENAEQYDSDSDSDIKAKLAKKEQECDEYLDLLKRSKAEFENYRKRSIKEKGSIYDDGFVDGIKAILPVIDNLERAITFDTSENDSLLEGVEMVLKMFYDTLAKNEVEEIPAEGENFDPHFHNAVMH
jgi:molecular chaperone GrpE